MRFHFAPCPGLRTYVTLERAGYYATGAGKHLCYPVEALRTYLARTPGEYYVQAGLCLHVVA